RFKSSGLGLQDLTPDGRNTLLAIFHNRGVCWWKLEETDKAIANNTEALEYFKSSGLGLQDLTPDGRNTLLAIFCNRGVRWGELEETDKDIANYTEALECFKSSGLGLQDLTPDGRNTLLVIFRNRGVCWEKLEETDKAIADGTEAIFLALAGGVDVYPPLEEMPKVAAGLFSKTRMPSDALSFLSFLHKDTANNFPVKPISRFLRILDQALAHASAAIFPCAQRWIVCQGLMPTSIVQPALLTLGVVFHLDAGCPARHLWQTCHAVLVPQLDKLTTRLGEVEDDTRKLKEAEQALRDWPAPGWRFWRWFERRRQKAVDACRTALSRAPGSEAARALCHKLASELAQELTCLGGIPDGPQTLGDMLLTGAYYAQSPPPAADAPIWAEDKLPWVAAPDFFNERLRLCELCFTETSTSATRQIPALQVKHHQDWLDELGGAALGARRARPFIELVAGWDDAMRNWHEDNEQPVREALTQAWVNWSAQAECLRIDPAAWYEATPLSVLARCLKPWLEAKDLPAVTAPVPATEVVERIPAAPLPVYRAQPVAERLEDAALEELIRRALHAVLGGDPRQALAEVIEQALWAMIEPDFRAASAEAGTEAGAKRLRNALRRLEDRLLLALPSLQAPPQLRRTLHGMARAQIGQALTPSAGGVPDLERLWELLEITRLVLAGEGHDDLPGLDDSAGQHLRASLDDELARAHRLLMPKPDDTPQPDDGPRRIFPPFVALAKEYRRLGVPKFPSPADCAAQLAEDEALAQMFFGDDGAAYLLWLDPAGKLRLQPLPEALAWPVWQDLLALWQAFYAQSSHDIHDRAWRAFIAPDGAAARLLSALEQGSPPETRHWVLLLPAGLARLPWLAGTLVAKEKTNWPDALRAPGALLLDACVSAWKMSAEGEDGGEDTCNAARVLVGCGHETDAFAALSRNEANKVAGHLKCAVIHSEDLTLNNALAMLTRGQPVHWVAHGEFQPYDPQASFIRLNGPEGQQRELPAWLLVRSPCRSPISLSSCYAMLTGDETASEPLLAPVGIGPLLRARGAPYVAGPLWASNMLASAVFYDKFYENLSQEKMEPHRALTEAMNHLRTLGAEDLRAWAAGQVDPESIAGIVEEMVQWSMERGEKRPLGNPLFWAQFSLIGGRRRER
ncbi:MAG: CHAT domain-containing protein, partial [Zoogloeaceae bacterium]|nr:CHAT domain-containing protein [Zoogloeaceae bacterium]